MKAVKTEENHALTTEELVRRESQYRESLFKMRMKLATGQFSQVADVNVTRKNLARILTEMNRRTGE